MKKVFSSLILVFTAPFRWLKKSKFDNFVGGLIFGALFALLVNIITVQFQELITKQKYLEALEHEITTHFIRAETIIKNIDETRKEQKDANPYLFTYRYDTTVWDSGETLGYIYDLEPSIQAKIITYYSPLVYLQNKSLDHIENSINQIEFEHMLCLFKNPKGKCLDSKNTLDRAANFYEETQLNIATVIDKNSLDLMKVFHPAQDRLNNPILRLLMGGRAQEILKRPDSNKAQ